MQRQLQLRIEAQGKYLKKIIEEQQRLSGVLSEAPGSGIAAPTPGDMCQQELDNKTEPATPDPEKAAKDHAPAKSLSVESFSSHHEPMTPDSGCQVGSPADSPNGERSTKKQRVSVEGEYSNPDMMLPHQILESSMPSYQQPVFLSRDHFDSDLGMSTRSGEELDKLGGRNMWFGGVFCRICSILVCVICITLSWWRNLFFIDFQF